MAEPRPQVLGERYELQERIGRGGLGVVYRALDRRLGRHVAVKLVADYVADDPDAVQRLEREALTTASITSPHVVQIFDFGVDGDRPYLVMEYLPDGTLAAQVAGHLPLPPAAVAEYGRQIAEGLAAAHARGLIHRDVTLRNVLVAPNGQLKVTDFGVAKVIGSTSLTRSGITIGTAASMAPEQARGQEVTPATDVYGLGVVLYELATGRPPFTGDSDIAVLLQHVEAPVPPPRHLNPAVPAWLERIILRALAKNPADRFADGAAIAQALRQGAATGAVVTPSVHPAPGASITTALPPTPPARRSPAPGTTAALSTMAPPAATAPAPDNSPARRRSPFLLFLAAVAGIFVLGAVALVALANMASIPGATTPTPATPTVPVVVATAPPTATMPPPTATPAPPTATAVRVIQPTATPRLPTPTRVPPTATRAPATPTLSAPVTTATPGPPTATREPAATAIPTGQPTAPPATPVPGNAGTPAPAERTVTIEDTAFSGSFRNSGDSRYPDASGEQRTATWIYGGNSDYPAMTARFSLDETPAGGARLLLVGMDGEDAGKMPLRISVNDTVIYEGPDPLPDERWAEAGFDIPPGVLREGENRLTIQSTSSQANFRTPHFFMLDQARIVWQPQAQSGSRWERRQPPRSRRD